MQKKALITGITGQDGSYLAEFLIAKNYKVSGLIRRTSTFNTGRIEHLYRDRHVESSLKLYHGDMSDRASISKVMREVKPDEVYHLAAQSHVRVSFDLPHYTFDCIASGTLMLLEVVKEVCPEAKVYNAASSEMFGRVVETPQKETTEFRPCSPYGVAKLAAYWHCVNYREGYGLNVSNGILFNHESPRRGETFVTRKITRGMTRIKEGLQRKLYLGNLDAVRDWGHARDYVEAMWLMLQKEKSDDYVIATGEAHSVEEFLVKVCGLLDVDKRDTVLVDAEYYRPVEVVLLKGDATKAKEKLGWVPKVSFDNLVCEMVESDWNLAKQEARNATK